MIMLGSASFRVRIPTRSKWNGSMDSQSKQDMGVAGGLISMFLGAFILRFSSLGLILIGLGAISIMLLILKVLRDKE